MFLVEVNTLVENYLINLSESALDDYVMIILFNIHVMYENICSIQGLKIEKHVYHTMAIHTMVIERFAWFCYFVW